MLDWIENSRFLSAKMRKIDWKKRFSILSLISMIICLVCLTYNNRQTSLNLGISCQTIVIIGTKIVSSLIIEIFWTLSNLTDCSNTISNDCLMTLCIIQTFSEHQRWTMCLADPEPAFYRTGTLRQSRFYSSWLVHQSFVTPNDTTSFCDKFESWETLWTPPIRFYHSVVITREIECADKK